MDKMGKIDKNALQTETTLGNFRLLVVILVILVVLIPLIFLHRNYSNQKQLIDQRLRSQSERIENNFVGALEYTEHSMDYIARQILSNDHGRINYYFIKTLLAGYTVPDHRIIELSTFAWANEKHRYIISSNKGYHFNENLDLSKRDYIPKTVSEPFKMHLGKLVYGIYSKKYSLPAGYGVVNDSGKYLGAVVVGFAIDGLERNLNEVINFDGISFVLIDDKGNLIAKSSGFDYNSIQAIVKKNLYKTKNTKTGFIYRTGIFNSLRNYGSIYYNNLEHYNYKVLTIYNKNLERAQLDSIVINYILIFILSLLLITFCLFLFYKKIINPIIEISANATKISNGDFDFPIKHYDNFEINELVRSISKVRDLVVTERKLKKYLESTNESKTNLIRATSHDLKNYILGISGISNMILENKKSGEIEKDSDLQLIQIINNQSTELLHFVEDLLDTNQIESGEFALKTISNINLNEVINRIISLTKNSSIEYKVFIRTELEEDLPQVRGDFRRMKQIFSNLISNALKYSNRDTTIKIYSKYLKDEKEVLVEIIDEGIGMSKGEIIMALQGSGEDIDKSQLNKTIDSHGIGLLIVKKLVELHEGRMEIQSKKGKGTTIKLYFKALSKATQKIQEKYSLEHDGSKKSVLLVEDNKINAKITSNILQSANCHVTWMDNGKKGVDAFHKEKFDLILMDIEMPIMNGYEASKEIRKNDKKTPIIALTSHSDKESIKEARDSGINRVLDKSTAKKELLDLVFYFFERDKKKGKKKK